MNSLDRIAVILPAGGRSVRFGGARNKLLQELAGRAVLWRTIEAFIHRPEVARVVLAVGEAIEEHLRTNSAARSLVRQWGDRLRILSGGASRAHSVLNGVRSVEEEIEWVAVHDAARPLVSVRLLKRTCAAAFQYGAAVPALPVALTIKQAQGPLPAPVQRTLPRAQLWAMQTPQVMRRADLLDAFARCALPLEQITDDAQLLELAGKPVWLVEGEERNIKITTPADLLLAQGLLDQPGPIAAL